LILKFVKCIDFSSHHGRTIYRLDGGTQHGARKKKSGHTQLISI